LVEVVVVRSNSIKYDPRVPKIIKSLSKRYSTLVLGWNRGFSKEPVPKRIEDYEGELKIFGLRGPSGSSNIVAYLPLFWIWTLVQLLMSRPKVVHACDFDTFLPCYVYKLMLKKRLVFDIHDRYAMAFISPTSRVLYRVVNMFEELFVKRADVLITVAEKLLMTFQKKPRWCEIIMNCAEDHAIDIINSRQEDDILTIAFTGHVDRSRGLEAILSVINKLDDVELIIAGRVLHKEVLNQASMISKAKYVGLLTPREALALEARSDVMIALYELKAVQNALALPLKVWEAMMCGVPIITNVAHELIKEVDCGIVLEYNNLDQIRNAIVILRDNKELRCRLGNNGRKAFLEKYNWSVMEQKLYRIYDTLLLKKIYSVN
jgi:glycosyltransferase involved in cell wall biosynthesis